MFKMAFRLTRWFAVLGSVVGVASARADLKLDDIHNAGASVLTEPADAKGIALHRDWVGDNLRSRITNTGSQPVKIRQIVLLNIAHDLPGETRLYGEGQQMLSQTGGTIAKPQQLGGYTDAKHYKIPQPDDATVVAGMITLSPPGKPITLIGFTSCKKFVGRFFLRKDSLQVVVETDGLSLDPGESWDLDEVYVGQGSDRAKLVNALAEQIKKKSNVKFAAKPPTGWCSWYCFGPNVDAEKIGRNLDFIAAHLPELRYIQIDDGYQSAMGDWLATGKSFGGDIKGILKTIKDKGFEPALWVAPFIAEAKSEIFQQHPDWFIKGPDGQPLNSATVSFGGWREGPWYCLDGTNPEVQKHLENLFKTMHEEWGVTYFKLDANYWGMMHGGTFHDPKASRVDAYRKGMEAIRRGAGDSFILGCNHPMWPSIGLIDGARSSNDVSRNENAFLATARENLLRGWQNGRLWWNDPDCVLLSGKLSQELYDFHLTSLFAGGGMVLSGDDLPGLGDDRIKKLRALNPPSGIAASFTDDKLELGTLVRDGKVYYCLFNWSTTPAKRTFKLSRPGRLTDYWSGKDFGKCEGTIEVPLAPHAAKLLVLQ